MRTFKVKFNAEWDEYIVMFYVDGVHQKNANYHTDSKDDAKSTGNFWASKE